VNTQQYSSDNKNCPIFTGVSRRAATRIGKVLRLARCKAGRTAGKNLEKPAERWLGQCAGEAALIDTLGRLEQTAGQALV